MAWYVLKIHRESELVVRTELDADRITKPYTPIAGPFSDYRTARAEAHAIRRRQLAAEPKLVRVPCHRLERGMVRQLR